jgi:hypothetical protein
MISGSVLGLTGRRLRAAIALFMVLAALGCVRRARFTTGTVGPDGTVATFAPAPTSIVVTGGPTAPAVREAIARALAARRYTLESEEGTRIFARFTSRGVSMRLAIDYSPTQVTVNYLDSTGLGFEDAMSSRQYDGWMRNLTSTMQEEIGRPAREAAEAVARAEEAQRQRERDAQEAEARERQRDRDERVERDRLAAARAQAEADAASARASEADARARRAEAIAHPRLAGVAHVRVGRLGFDATQAGGIATAISLSAGFSPDPLIVSGAAGGPMTRDRMGFPRACPGFFQAQPQHTIVLHTDVPYLRIEAPSDGDATLAIVAPDGSVWCDDDGAGNYTPRVAGWFPAGVYQVYVGNYNRGEIASYQLMLTELDVQAAPPVYAQAEPPPPPADCRGTLLSMGHPGSSLMFCDGVGQECAVALLRAGHPPSSLIHCSGAQPACAVQMMESGRNPTELIFCR